jgi:hypothetical protein
LTPSIPSGYQSSGGGYSGGGGGGYGSYGGNNYQAGYGGGGYGKLCHWLISLLFVNLTTTVDQLVKADILPAEDKDMAIKDMGEAIRLMDGCHLSHIVYRFCMIYCARFSTYSHVFFSSAPVFGPCGCVRRTIGSVPKDVLVVAVFCTGRM